MNIIIVDDDKLVSLSLKTILEASGEVNVCAIGNCGEEALSLYPKSLTEQAHVGIVTSNDGQTAYYSAHTTDHCNKIMTAYYKEVMDFYIPVWDSHTGTWTKL